MNISGHKRKRCHAKKVGQTQPDTAADGNTSSAADIRKRGWFFTDNMLDTLGDGQYKTVITLSGSDCDYVMQLEKGDEKEHLHLQGVVYFKSARKFSQVKSLLPGVHVEPCKSKSAAIDYCQKVDTAMGQIWSRGFALNPTDTFQKMDPRPWQREVLTLVSAVPDDRTIWWVWDRLGGAGKTKLQKHLALKGECIVVSGKAADIKYAIASRVKERKPIKIVFFNFARSQEEFISYEAIEQVKDGLFFSSKYESDMCIYDSPHVICMANFPPKLNKLSEDRWNIREIN